MIERIVNSIVPHNHIKSDFMLDMLPYKFVLQTKAKLVLLGFPGTLAALDGYSAFSVGC